MTDDPEAELNPDLPHRIVTSTDREVLTTDDYFEDHKRPSASRSQQQRKLRARVRGALEDLWWLSEYAPRDEQENIFEGLDEWQQARDFFFRPEVRYVLDATSGENLSGDSPATTNEELPAVMTPGMWEQHFENSLERSIEHALAVEGAGDFDVDIDIDITPLDGSVIDTAVEKLQQGGDIEDLTEEEMLNFIRAADRAGGVDIDQTVDWLAAFSQESDSTDIPDE